MKNQSPVQIDEKSLLSVKELTYDVLLKENRNQAYSHSGTAKSPFRTRGLDFQEIRAYQQGDDIRQIDWKTTAKHGGKPYTKLYTDEKEQPVYFVCDLRGTMKFASNGVFKSVIVARLAMFMAFLAERRQDRIGSVVLLENEIKQADLQSNGGAMALMTDILAGGEAIPRQVDETTLEDALSLLAKEVKTGAKIFILSDMHDLTEGAVEILKRISFHRTVSLIQVYDKLEQEMPEGLWAVTDGIHVSVANMTKKESRENFKERFKKQFDFIQKAVDRNGWGYLPIQTTDDYILKIISFVQMGGL